MDLSRTRRLPLEHGDSGFAMLADMIDALEGIEDKIEQDFENKLIAGHEPNDLDAFETMRDVRRLIHDLLHLEMVGNVEQVISYILRSHTPNTVKRIVDIVAARDDVFDYDDIELDDHPF